MAFKITSEEKQKVLASRATSKKAPNYLGKLLKKLVKNKKVLLTERDAQFIEKEIWYIDPRRVDDLDGWEGTDQIKDDSILELIIKAYIRDTVWSEKN